MCYICQYIIKERPNLKELDRYKSNYPNVYIIKSHLPTLAIIAKEYSPILIKEVLNEKDTTITATATNNSSIK